MKINKELINSLITNVSNEVDLTREQYEKLENIFNNVIGIFLAKRSSTDIEIDDETILRVHMINVLVSNKYKEHSEIYCHELNHVSEPEMKSRSLGFTTQNELEVNTKLFEAIEHETKDQAKIIGVIGSGSNEGMIANKLNEEIQLKLINPRIDIDIPDLININGALAYTNEHNKHKRGKYKPSKNSHGRKTN